MSKMIRFITPACISLVLAACGLDTFGLSVVSSAGTESSDMVTAAAAAGTAGPAPTSEGGGATGGNSSTSTEEGMDTALSTGVALPGMTALMLEFSSIKQFDFSWSPAVDAEFYRLRERVEADREYVEISSPITETTLSLTMPLHLRSGASYILAACNTGGCTDSALVTAMDPLTAAVGYVKASNTGTDTFAYSLALSADGGTLAVGARGEDSGIEGNQANNDANDAGAVYVFVREGATWTQTAYLKASNVDAIDQFGTSVGLSGDGRVLAVGAPRESSGSGIDGDQTDDSVMSAGAVYLFEVMDGSWAPKAYLKASNPGANDYFGTALTLSEDGNTLAVGAPHEDSGASGIDGDQASNAANTSGAVYMFRREVSSWSQKAYIKASNARSNGMFGASLALSELGDTLVVGAPGDSSAAEGIDGDQSSTAAVDAGAVYVFTEQRGVWSQQAYIKASNTGKDDLFGSSVALARDGDTLAVGAKSEDSGAVGINKNEDNDSVTDSGAVYLFDRDDGVWSQQVYIKALNSDAWDAFGLAVALSADGTVLAVGAIGEDSDTVGVGGPYDNEASPQTGAVYVFAEGPEGWVQEEYVKASNPDSDDQFGWSLGLSEDGDTLVVAAPGEASAATGIGGDPFDNSVMFAGAVYLY